MLSKNIIIALLAVCFAGVLVVLATPDEGQLNGLFKVLAGGDPCSVCKFFVNRAKSMGKPEQWKPKLEHLCTRLHHEEMINKCKDNVDKYIGDLEHKSPEEFCKEMHLCCSHQ